MQHAVTRRGEKFPMQCRGLGLLGDEYVVLVLAEQFDPVGHGQRRMAVTLTTGRDQRALPCIQGMAECASPTSAGCAANINITARTGTITCV